jgi:ABC-type phosphate transport system substrate-binding protein
MRVKFLVASFFLTGLSIAAHAESVVITSKANDKTEKLEEKDLADLYSGEKSRLPSKAVARLCKRSDEKTRKEFYDSIGKSENEAEANKAKQLATGRGNNVANQKSVSDTKTAIQYVLVNSDGGVCYLSKQEYDALSPEDKQAVKVVYTK